MPDVTIGMPVYNGEAYIEEAFSSLLRQTFSNFELLISDDGSTDRTPEIGDDVAGGDERIRVFQQAPHLGMMANFRFVLDRARAPLFMWAAQDDLWDPRFIEATKALLDADMSAIGAISAIQVVEVQSDGRRFEEDEIPGAISTSGAARTLASTSGHVPRIDSGPPRASCRRSASPLRRALLAATRSASPSRSIASARGTPSVSAAKASTPEPVHRPAPRPEERSARSPAGTSRHSAVVGCSPAPKADASINLTVSGACR